MAAARREGIVGLGFRLRPTPWVPLMVPFAMVLTLTILSIRFFTFFQPRGMVDIRYWVFIVLCFLAPIVTAYFAWHLLIAWGIAPLFVMWERGEAIFMGTLPARLGLSRRRMRVRIQALRAEIMDSQRRQPQFGHVTHLRFTAGAEAIEIRTYGRVKPEEVEHFVFKSVGRLGGTSKGAGTGA